MIDLLSLGVRDTYMGYLEYQNLAGHRMDFLMKDMWDWSIAEIDLPRAVWMPPLERLKAQTKTMDIGVNGAEVEVKTVELRGFTFKQSATNKRSPGGDVTWTLIDWEDQAILAFAQSWASACGHNKFRFRFRKEDSMIGKMSFYILNNVRLPVRVFTLYGVVFAGYEIDNNNGEETPEPRTQVTIKLSYEEYDMTILNLPAPFTF